MINLINTALAHTAESGETDLFAAHHGFGMMGGFGFGWLGMFFGWTLMILFWALVILAVIALVKYISPRGYNGSDDKTTKGKALGSSGKTYICSECGYEYKEKEWAMKCQKWCAQHKSCNMGIIKHSTPPKT